MDIAGKRKITPSKPDYWTGTPVQGATFTREQTVKMQSMRSRMTENQRRYQLPPVYDVRIIIEPTVEHPLPRTVLFPCPVISGTKDRTRLCVIAPNGMDAWVSWK